MSGGPPYADLVEHTPVDVAVLDVCGTPTRVWRYGAVQPRTTILFLHGFRGDHHGLEPIVAHLVAADPGLRVLVPDLPGFGATPPLPRAHDLDGFTGWARDLIEAHAGEVVLAGHSFGSIVAATVVARDVAGVAGLVLVNPIAGNPLTGSRVLTRRATAAFHQLAGALPERAGTALLRHPAITRIASGALVTTRDRELRRWIHAEHRRWFSGFADRRSVLEAFTTSTAHDVAEVAPAVKVPTLLVAGALDDLAPPETQRALLDRLPDARLVLLPDTGHLAHYEQPAAVAAAIVADLA